MFCGTFPTAAIYKYYIVSKYPNARCAGAERTIPTYIYFVYWKDDKLILLLHPFYSYGKARSLNGKVQKQKRYKKNERIPFVIPLDFHFGGQGFEKLLSKHLYPFCIYTTFSWWPGKYLALNFNIHDWAYCVSSCYLRCFLLLNCCCRSEHDVGRCMGDWVWHNYVSVSMDNIQTELN